MADFSFPEYDEDGNLILDESEEETSEFTFPSYDQTGSLVSETKKDDSVSATISDLSTGTLRSAPPSSDMYQGYPTGNRDNTREKRLAEEARLGEELPLTAWEIYNDLTAQNEDGSYKNKYVRSGVGGMVYDDPVSGRSFTLSAPTSTFTGSVPILGQGLDYLYEKVAPEAYSNDSATTNRATMVTNEVIDGGTNLVELGAAGIDALTRKGAELVGSDSFTGTNLTESARKIPRQSTGFSTTDALVGEGTALMLSFFTGAGLAKAGVDVAQDTARFLMKPLTSTKVFQTVALPVLKEIAPTTNRLMRIDPKALAAAIGGDLGVAAGSDTETETLLFGSNSTFNKVANPYGVNVLGVDPQDNAADAVLAARTNILLDSLLTSGIIGTGIKATAAASNFLYEATLGPVLRSVAMGEEGIKMSQVAWMLDDLARIEAKSTQADVDAARQRLVQTIQANKELVLEMVNRGGETKDIGFDVLTAMEKGETVSDITRSKIRELRKGVINNASNDGATRQKMGEFGDGLEDFLEEGSQDVLTQGGNTVADAANIIVDAGRSRVDEASTNIAGIQGRRAAAEQEVVDAMLQDEAFGASISKLVGASPSTLTTSSTQSREQIASAVVDNLSAAVDKKNALYDAIPEGTPFDVEAFGKLISDITKEANAFDTSGKEVLQNTLIATIRSAYNNKTTAQGADPLGGMDGVADVAVGGVKTTEEIVTSILESGADFKVLYNSIRPRISEMIVNAKGTQSQVDVVRRLRTVRDFIDEQVNWVSQNTDNPETAKAATDAFENYKQFAATYKDEPFNRVVDAFESTAGGSFNPRQVQTASRNEVVGVLEGDVGQNMTALVNILEQQGSAVDRTSVSEYTTAKIFEGIYRDVRNNGLENVDVAALEDQIIRYSTNLREEFFPLATQLDTLADRIRTAQAKGISIDDELKLAESQFAEMKNDAFSNMVAPFLDTYSDGAVSLNATDKMISILSGSKGADFARAALANTDDNPIVMEGLESAYLRALKRAVVTSKEDIAGSPVLSASNLKKTLENDDMGLLNTGRVVLANKPKLAVSLEEALAVGEGVAKGRIAQTNPATSGTSEIEAYRAAVNRTIYMFVGALSRAGAQSRAASQFIANKLGLKDRGVVALDVVVADADEFIRLADKVKLYRETVGVPGFDNDRMSNELFEEMYKAGIRAGIYSESDIDRENAYSFWGAAITAENVMTKTVAPVLDAIEN